MKQPVDTAYSMKVQGSDGVTLSGVTRSWYIAMTEDDQEKVTIAGITVFQSTVGSDAYVATNGIGVATTWCHVEVVAMYSINWWALSLPATGVDVTMQLVDGS